MLSAEQYQWLEAIRRMVPKAQIVVVDDHRDATQWLAPAAASMSPELTRFTEFARAQSATVTTSASDNAVHIALPINDADCQQIGLLALQCDATAELEPTKRAAEWAGVWLGLLMQRATATAKAESNALPENTQADAIDTPQSRWRTKPIYAAAVVALIGLLLIPVDYRIPIETVVEGQIEAPVIAPQEGYIEHAYVKAGDSVKQGEVMALLDQQQLTLKLAALRSQQQEKQKQYRKSLSERDRNQAAILKAQLAQTDIAIEQAKLELGQTQLASPISGWVIDGDISRSIGAPVAKGDVLFKVSPANAYRATLRIAQRDMRFIRAGQAATLKLAALPDLTIQLQMQAPTPLHQDEDNRILYLAEAALLDAELDKLRPGMEGIAKVNVGAYPIGWQLFHHFTDWVRLNYWAYRL